MSWSSTSIMIQESNFLPQQQGQWNKKKQTKKEAAAARRGKLDPDSELNRNAKEVMDERARHKREMREAENADDDDEDEDEEEEDQNEEDDDMDDDADNSFDAMDGVEIEMPGQGLKSKTESEPKSKKKEVEVDSESEEEIDISTLSKKDQKKLAKRERKQEKKAAKKAQKDEGGETKATAKPTLESSKKPKTKKTEDRKQAANEDETAAAVTAAKEDAEMVLDGFDNGDDESPDQSAPHSPTFDAEIQTNSASAEPSSATTSVSSTIPPSEKPKHIKIPADTSVIRARLEAKIAALRAARKADGPDGKPIRTRQELIESRRVKQAQRKEHKQEVRRLAKVEQERKREEALATNSPGIMSPAVEIDESSFSFGRVAFGDGSQMSHDLSYVLNQGKKKGPSDPKTALIKVQNQKKRLNAMDEETRNDIADKDAWLTARRRAEGEKIRDDETILKKTIKRKEVAKRKSEKAWTERIQSQDHSQKERQKKREENLRKRRDDKLIRKVGGKKKKPSAGKKKKSGRPGFEGSFGVGGSKKK